jgi:cellulose synthase/poly-beta-1,6-N-acetylglucosamine synthase-like glycosyltransferase
LNAGIESLRDDPPDVVVIMDADCVMEHGSLDMLVAMARRTSKPAQARYVMHSSTELGILGRISAFAFLVRNVVRPLGLSRIGQPCHLMGTGMAFPWAVVEMNPVPKDHLVEDLQMGIDLLRQGHGPQFCNSAQVTSQFPPSRDGSRQQHKRWTHGHLQTILQEVLPLLGRAVRRKRTDLVLAALDLAVPPLSMLVMLLVVALAGMALVYQIGGPVLPFLSLTVVAIVFFASILAAWTAYGRNTISPGALLLAPLYAVMKVPSYLDFMKNPKKTWQSRSERDSDRPVDAR